MKLYIAVLTDVPDYIVPTLVAHTMLNAHINFTSKFVDLQSFELYKEWLDNSFKKCVVQVNQKEFDKIASLPYCYLGHENKTLDGKKSCAIPIPVYNTDLPNVLKFAKLWSPRCPAIEKS